MKLKRERGFPRFLTDTVLSINKGRDAAREHHAMKVRITSISSLDVLNTRARKQKKTSTIMKLQHCDLLLATKFRPRRFAAEWPSSVSRPSLMMSKLWLMLRRPPVVAGPHLPSASTCLQHTYFILLSTQGTTTRTSTTSPSPSTGAGTVHLVSKADQFPRTRKDSLLV